MTIERPRIKVEGAPVSSAVSDLLIDVRVELAVNTAGRATVRFFDHEFDIIDSEVFKIGKVISIDFFPETLGTPEAVRVFDGEVTAIATDVGPSDMHELVITCFDKSHRLRRGARQRTMLNVTYSNVVSKIASESGLQADVDGCGSITFPHLLQTSDNATFLTEIAQRTGTQWYVDGAKLKVFAPSNQGSPPTLTLHETLRTFRTRFSAAEQVGDVIVQGWDEKNKVAIVGRAPATADPPQLTTAPLASDNRTKHTSWGADARHTGTLVVQSQTEAEQVAKALHARAATSEILARGEALGTPSLRPGGPVEIAGVGRRLSGVYYLTTVEHIFSTRGQITRFSAGSLAPASLVDLVGSRSQSSWGRTGPTIGLVTNTKDPENRGRIKVKFPVQGDTVESDWAKLVMPGAGKDRGLMFVPEVNDEVLVLFEHGDTRRPIVLGGMWNGVDAPPLKTDTFLDSDGKTFEWGVKSRAGHTVMIRNGPDPDKHSIELKLADGVTTLLLTKEKVELRANSKPLQIQSGQASITLDQDNVTIKGQKISIEGNDNVVVKSTAKVQINGTGGVDVQSSGPASLKGNGGVAVESAAMTQIKGSMVKIN